MSDYSQFLIREYKYWNVFLHQSQYYLGRTYIWLKRDQIVDLFDISTEERDELFYIIAPELKSTLKALFQPDLFNWAALANDARHCHIHLIPRYESCREFAGIKFIDEQWGKNYAPYNTSFRLAETDLFQIRDALRSALSCDQSPL